MAIRQRLNKMNALLAAAILLPAVAQAVDVQVAGEAGGGVSDNIGRTAANPRKEAIATVGVQFSVFEASRKVDVDIAGDLAYQDYLRGTYRSEVIGNAGGSLRLQIVEDHLDWMTQDNFGQARRDPLAVPTPDNREYINYFSTGPNVRVNLFSEAKLLLGARYTRVDYETSPLDSTRYSGQLGLERELSAGARVSLNVSDERVEPESRAGVAHYDRQEAYGRYLLEGARGNVALDAGASRVDLPSGAESGLLLRLALSRKVGSLSTLHLEAGQQSTDSGNAMASGLGSAVLSAGGDRILTQVANPYTQKFARLGWDVTGRRTGLSLSAGFSDDHYGAILGADRQERFASATLTRQFGARLSGSLGYRYLRDEYKSSLANFSESTASAGLAWRLGSQLSVTATAEHANRSAQGGLGSSSENRGWLRLRYGAASVRQPGDVPRRLSE